MCCSPRYTRHTNDPIADNLNASFYVAAARSFYIFTSRYYILVLPDGLVCQGRRAKRLKNLYDMLLFFLIKAKMKFIQSGMLLPDVSET